MIYMNNDFIVSMASHIKRIDTIHLCLDSIYNQTLKPKKILLYLDSSVDPNNLPVTITPFIEAGLCIRYVSNELGPHNKYFYTFQEFEDEIIITVDDDVIYNKTTFYNLIKTHIKYPNSICANRVKYMIFNDKKLLSYNEWISEYDKLLLPSKKLLATGVGGILYPPNILPNELLNKNNIVNLALYADDLWLKIMELKNNVPVTWTGQLPQHPKQIPNTMSVGLWRTVNKFKNDEYMNNLINYFNMDIFSLVEMEDKII